MTVSGSRQARYAIIAEAFPATLVEFIRHFVKLFTYGGLFVGIQCIQFFKQRQAMAFDKSRHVDCGLFLFGQCTLSVFCGASL